MLNYVEQYIFLRAKHFTSTEIHPGISSVYGPHQTSSPAIVKWCQMFEYGRTDLTNAEIEERTATDSSIRDIVQRVDGVISRNS